MEEKKINAKIIDKKYHSKDIFSLFFDRNIFSNFVPGQYINIFAPEIGTEAKSYSISSSIFDPYISITVKKIGVFSSYLNERNIGDKIHISLPYGFFYSEEDNTNKVFIAGGIGITPFHSMIKSSKEIGGLRLWYSSKTKEDMVYFDEFKKILGKNFHPHITREKISGTKLTRINPKEITEILDDKNNTEFFICGSIEFVRDIWKGLKAQNVPEINIFTESFF